VFFLKILKKEKNLVTASIPCAPGGSDPPPIPYFPVMR
jgi:hypothetical protein